MQELKEMSINRIQELPQMPGVYLFKDKDNKVIYVGKALNLRHRVRSYFQKPSQDSVKLKVLVEKIESLSYIITDSEEEAFILELNLIKEYSPRYNIQFKDDKAYPYLCLTLGENFPRLVLTRRVENRGHRYFGPYSSVGAVKETMKLIKKLFPLRSCKQQLEEGKAKGRPCLNYQIKRCLAPCQGQITLKEYAGVVEQVSIFLEGRQTYLLKKIEREMNAAAEALDFEKAAMFRDQHIALQKMMERQKAVTADLKDRDVIALVPLRKGYIVGLFRVRGGKLLGAEHFTPRKTGGAGADEIMKEFLRHYYDKSYYVPGELLLSHLPVEEKLIAEWLQKKKGGRGRVRMKVPHRGEKKALLELVKRNALLHAQQEQERLDREKSSLSELGKRLGLEGPPLRIEGYDISHFSGREPVGTMVVFYEGRPLKKEYRRFKVRTAAKADDYAALAEVLQRRFKNQELPPPSLILLDGGRGQLSVAQKVLQEKSFANIPLVALAEEQEQIFLPGKKDPLVLPATDPALKILQQVRDEAHRFALSLSRDLNVKNSLASILMKVPGIGPTRSKALLKHFGSLERLRKASLEELTAVPSMNGLSARNLYKEFHDEAGL